MELDPRPQLRELSPPLSNPQSTVVTVSDVSGAKRRQESSRARGGHRFGPVRIDYAASSPLVQLGPRRAISAVRRRDPTLVPGARRDCSPGGWGGWGGAGGKRGSLRDPEEPSEGVGDTWRVAFWGFSLLFLFGTSLG